MSITDGSATPSPDGLRTLCEAFQRTVARYPDRVALRTPGGETQVSYREYGRRVQAAADALHALGVRYGDRVALMLPTCLEFHVIDAAAIHLGAVSFSIYNTSSPEQIEFMIADAAPRIAVAERELHDRIPFDVVVTPARLVGPDAPCSEDFDFDAAWRSVKPEDLLTIIYTSGTTGSPKGVQLTHENTLICGRLFDSVVHFGEEGAVVSYLPMAHIAERNSSHYWAMMFGFTVTLCPDASAVFDYFPDARPTWFYGVPRIMEKLCSRIESTADESLRREIDLGMRRVRGAACRPPNDDVLGQLRSRIGLDRIISMNVGAAPSSPDLIEFFLAIGLPLGELWGMSETSGPATCNPSDQNKVGTVGPAIPGIDVRVDDEGEVQVRGGVVFAGYRNQPALTEEMFTEDGWLRSGDLGRMDEDGYLSIVGRKKELIINSAGKNMSPTAIESALKDSSPIIGSAVVIGDRRPYNVALVVLDPEATVALARQHGLGDRTLAELADEPAVVAAIGAGVANANARLSRPEQIKRFRVLSGEWLPGGDELTPTMKLKRQSIEEKYADEIAFLYETR